MSKNTYKQSGVNVFLGDLASAESTILSRKTFRPEVKDLGSFVGFTAKFKKYKTPLLLGATDGVGTKLKIAFSAGKHETVGIDLVAMSVNDLLRRGAEPLIFLPYFAFGKIDVRVAAKISAGIVAGCRMANCAIIGGETAELPGFYHPGEYDLAGTAIGVVEEKKVITGEKIKTGDRILALPSNGLHSNGYSLARKVLLDHYKLSDRPKELGGKTLASEFLTPTKIYVAEVMKILGLGIEIHGLAHITGGGVNSKLGKIIPKGLSAQIDFTSWQPPPIFGLIQKLGEVSDNEMFSTFNMGLGMVMVLPEKSVARVKKQLKETLEIGTVVQI